MDYANIDTNSKLFKKVKLHIGVTWEYQDEDVLDIVQDGVVLIQSKVGPIDDFLDNRLAFSLLKAYCRYAWEGMESLFEENYRHDLLNLQLVMATKRFGGAQ